MEILAMHKSKRYIILGACFPVSILFPHLLFLTAVSLPLCFTFYVLGGSEIRAGLYSYSYYFLYCRLMRQETIK